MCVKGKKRRKGEMGVVFKGKRCARGACTGSEARTASPWPKAAHTIPPRQKAFHRHLGMAGKAGHVQHTEHGAARREGQQVPCAAGAPWMELDGPCSHVSADEQPRTALPHRAAALSLPTPLSREMSVLPCTPKVPAKGRREFPRGALCEHRGMSSPRVPAIPSVCQAPAQTAA